MELNAINKSSDQVARDLLTNKNLRIEFYDIKHGISINADDNKTRLYKIALSISSNRNAFTSANLIATTGVDIVPSSLETIMINDEYYLVVAVIPDMTNNRILCFLTENNKVLF